jgi:hypothetical protein
MAIEGLGIVLPLPGAHVARTAANVVVGLSTLVFLILVAVYFRGRVSCGAHVAPREHSWRAALPRTATHLQALHLPRQVLPRHRGHGRRWAASKERAANGERAAQCCLHVQCADRLL